MNTSDVVNRLTYHRSRQGPLLNYLDKVDPKLSSKLAGCGSWLHIREWEISGESRLRNANFCKCFLGCCSCAARRAGKLKTAFLPKVLAAMDEDPKLIPVMITLTLKNGPDLKERINHLKASWKRMLLEARKGKSVSGRHPKIEWNKVLGSIKSMEVTKNYKTGEWHPHVHVFALVSEYINRFHLTAEWERFTGDSIIVHVRKAEDDVSSALTEVLKYVSKPSKLTPADLHYLMETAKGSRFTDAQGLLRGVPEPCIDSDDDEGLTGAYRDFILLWSGIGYQMQSVGHRLEILRPGDSGYGAPRELVPCFPGDEGFDAGVAFPPEHMPPPRQYYAETG